MAGFSVGSATVDIVPDARGFETKLKAAIRDVTVQVKAELDANGIQQRLNALARNVTVKVNVDLDLGDAQARLDAFCRDRVIKVRTDADTGKAEAQLDTVARRRTATVKADDEGSFFQIGAQASAASGVISALIATAASLGPTIVPAAAAAAGAIAAIGPAALSSVAGIGVLVAGFHNIFGAVGESLKAQDAVSLGAAKTARTAVDSASRIAAAQQGLAAARASLRNTQANEASASRASAQAVVDAQAKIRDAHKAAADGVQVAVQRQVAAERTLNSALLSEEQAQRSLSLARQQAKRDIEDLTAAVQGGQLSQRQAALDVQTTYDALVASQDSGSRIEREQAQLAYDRAVQAQKDAATNQARLIDEQKKAKQQGVEGAPVVTNAKQNVADAKAAVVEAQNAAVAATKAIAAAREAGNKQVAAAERDLADAELARADQQRQSAFAVSQAQGAVVSAQRSLDEANKKTATSATEAATALDRAKLAMSKLTPEGRALATFLVTTLIPGYEKLRDVAQAPLASGALAGLKAAAPVMGPITDLVRNLATAFGDLFRDAGNALGSPFWLEFFQMLANTGGPAIHDLGEILGNLITGLAGIFEKFQPIGAAILGWLVELTQKFEDFGTGKTDALQRFFDYVSETGPMVAGALGSIIRAVGELIMAAAPIGETVLKVFADLADKIAGLDPKILTAIVLGFSALATVIPGIIALVAVLSAVGTAIGFVTTGIGLWVLGTVGAVAAIGILAAKFQPFRDFLVNDLWPALKQIGEIGLTAIQEGLDYVKDAIDRNGPAISQMVTDFRAFADFLLKVLVPIVGTVLKGVITGLFTMVGDLIDWISKAYGYVHEFAVKIGADKWLKDFGNGLVGAAEDLGNFKGVLDHSATSADKAGSAVGGAARNTAKLKDASGKLKTAQDRLNTSLQDSINNFTILKGGALDSAEAQMALNTALLDVSESAKENGHSLSEATKKGIANRTSVIQAIKSVNEKITADFKAGLTAQNFGKHTDAATEALKQNRKRLEEAAVAAGFSRTEVKKMLAQYSLTPDQLATEVKANGVDKAKGEVNGFKATVDSLKDKTIDIKTNLQFGSKTISKEAIKQLASGAMGPKGFAAGGPVPLTPGAQRGKDSVPALLMPEEHVWTSREVAAVGGHGAMLRMRQAALTGDLPRFANGGAVRRKIRADFSANEPIDLKQLYANEAESAKALGTAMARGAKTAMKKAFDAAAESSAALYQPGGKVKGFSADQLRNAAAIASAGASMGSRAQMIGIATAIVESGLRNLSGGDRDSVGLFQQRGPWGSFAARHNPKKSAEMFFHGGAGGQRGLDDINWRLMAPGRAAQAVQVSAFPGRYATQMDNATRILESLKNLGGQGLKGAKATGSRVWPTNTQRLSGNYRGHSGVDIAAGYGAPIYAAAAGRIGHTGYGKGYGNAIFETANGGLQMVYGHGSRVLVHTGQAVKAGQRIGEVGATGNATGPHLHFEIAPSGKFALSGNRAKTLNWLHSARYDKGGWLQPGTTIVHNKTGKPEPILNPDQWRAFQQMAAGGGRQGPAVHIDTIETTDARGVAAAIESRMLLREALYPSWT